MKRVMGIILMVIVLTACGGKKISVEPGGRMVVFGDSITNGYGVEKSFSHYLDESLEIEVVPVGRNGETTRGGVKRLEEVENLDPKVVFIELGGNDLLQRMDARETSGNMTLIVKRLQRGGRIVVLAKFYPRRTLLTLFMGESRREYDQMYKSLEEVEGVYVIENLWGGVWGKHMLDTIHPDGRGHEVMAENIEESLRKIIRIK